MVVDGATKPGEAVPARDVSVSELDVVALQEVEEPHEQREESGWGEAPLLTTPTEVVLRRKRMLLPVSCAPNCSIVQGTMKSLRRFAEVPFAPAVPG